MSSSDAKKGGGGGILRGSKQQKSKGSNGSRDHGHVVAFSNNVDERTVPSRATTINMSRNINIANDGSGGGGGYDSDEVEDAILASGDTFSLGRQHAKTNNHDEDDIMDDAAVRTLAEIEEAKRKRGRVRRHEDPLDDKAREGIKSLEEDDDNHMMMDSGMSLITDQDKDPDAYESNAGENAECPVEPFNMDAEKDGGLGYFDGDTYVFRQNQNAVDGEDDAWLDGLGDDKEKEIGGGGLDSTSVWKPSTKDASSSNNKKQKRKAKFISEDDIPEDIGRRVATLLQSENETVMMALTRHGAAIRELQSQEQKMIKKSKVKKRKSKSGNKEDKEDNSSSTTTTPTTSGIDIEMKQLKIKMEQTRETIEELTELADALLFGGETEAYELTKSDWIHKFKLEQYFPSSTTTRKRPPIGQAGGVGDDNGHATKKSRGYFDTTDESKTDEGGDTKKPPEQEVAAATTLWEYKGNEDGSIHGPYTSQQMLDWTSCGYFVGESAVDIRRVGSSSNVATNTVVDEKDTKQKSEDDTKADVDDLMADLMDDDDDDDDKGGEGETKNDTTDTSSSTWMRSDRVDFSLYL